MNSDTNIFIVTVMYSIKDQYWNTLYEMSINLKDKTYFKGNFNNFLLSLKIIKKNFNKNNLCQELKILTKEDSNGEFYINLHIEKIIEIEIKKQILCINFDGIVCFALRFDNVEKLNIVNDYLKSKINILTNHIIAPIKENLKKIYDYIWSLNKNKESLEELIIKWIFKDYLNLIINEFKKAIKNKDILSIKYIYKIVFELFKSRYCGFLKLILDDRIFKYFLLMIKYRENLEKEKNQKEINIKQILNQKFINIFNIQNEDIIKYITCYQKLNSLYYIFFNENDKELIDYYEVLMDCFSKKILDFLIENNLKDKMYSFLYHEEKYLLLDKIKTQSVNLLESLYSYNKEKYEKIMFDQKTLLLDFNKLKIEMKDDTFNLNFVKFYVGNIKKYMLSNSEIFLNFEKNLILQQLVTYFFNNDLLIKSFLVCNYNILFKLKNPTLNLDKKLTLAYFNYFKFLISQKKIDKMTFKLYFQIYELFEDFMFKYEVINELYEDFIEIFNKELIIYWIKIKLNKHKFFNFLCLVYQLILKNQRKNDNFFKENKIFEFILNNLKKFVFRENIIFSKILSIFNIVIENHNLFIIDEIKIYIDNNEIPKILKNYKNIELFFKFKSKKFKKFLDL